MARQTDVHGFLGSRLVLAPNTVTEVSVEPGQLGLNIKLLAGGTLEIGGATGASGQTFGLMYPININEIISVDMAGRFYVWASGATCTVALLRARSAGF